MMSNIGVPIYNTNNKSICTSERVNTNKVIKGGVRIDKIQSSYTMRYGRIFLGYRDNSFVISLYSKNDNTRLPTQKKKGVTHKKG